MADLATLAIDGPVATLTLSRPEQRNALSLDLIGSIVSRIDELAEREGATVCVVTGAGRAFCAGMDLREVVLDGSAGGSGDPEMPRRLLGAIADVTLRLRRLRCVTIASVNGAAIGGGCGLACVCDAVISHADARLGFPEVDLGVCPAVVAPWLVKKIGAGRARSVLLRGGVMSGSDAKRIGIVDHLADDADGLSALTSEISARIAEGGPAALAETKRLLNEVDHSLDEDLLTRAVEISAAVVATPDAQTRLAARLSKAS